MRALRPWGSRIINWPSPILEEDEVMLLNSRANLASRGIARGGTLILTSRRVLFMPNSFEVRLGQLGRSWDRADVTGFRLANRGPSPVSGAWRRRLAIDLKQNESLFFVVPHAAQLVDDLVALS